jgi:segregation and condensation protein A
MDSQIQEQNAIPRTRDYYAKLTDYEGPLDILLHFVKEEELNVYDIPISKIVKDFLGYIEYMQSLDIEFAGEFLLLASELMKIKARLLIPQIDESGEPEEEDPRLTLIRKLLEYKRFKDVSAELSKFEDEARKRAFRKFFKKDEKIFQTEIIDDPSLKSLTVFNLIKGYRYIVSNIRKEVVHPIELLNITPEGQREFLINFLNERASVDFKELIINMDEKILIICTFLSVLQLALEGVIEIVVNREKISEFSLKKIILDN